MDAVPRRPLRWLRARRAPRSERARLAGLVGIPARASGDGLQVKGQAGLDAFVDWLAALQRDQGLRVQRLEVQGQGSAASIDAVLVQHDG